MPPRASIRRRLWPLVAALVAALALAAPAFAAGAGSLDPSFGSDGASIVPVGSTAAASAVVVQPDGRVVTAGAATVNGQTMILSTRMTTSGALDPSYGVGGIVTVPIYGSSSVYSGAGLALQSDGKIVIAGEGRNGTYGPEAFAAVRLNPDGSLDQTFGKGGIALASIGTSAVATGLAIEPNGEIALGGIARNAQGQNQFAAALFTAGGALDTSFGRSGTAIFGPTASPWGMVLQSDGKLVLVGQAAYGSGAQQFIAERLTATGALDSSYGRNGVVKVPVGSTALGFGIALQPDGKTILTGPAFTTKGVAAAVRLNTNGSLDQTFGTGGIATVPDWYGVNGVVLDGQGRIVMPTVGAGAVRLNQNGSADLTFGNGGVALAPLGAKGGANGAAIDPTTGNVVLAGAATINGVTELTAIRMLGSSDATVALRADVRKPATGKRRASTAAVHHGHHRRHRNRRHHRAHKHRRAAHGLSRSVLRRSAHAAVR